MQVAQEVAALALAVFLPLLLELITQAAVAVVAHQVNGEAHMQVLLVGLGWLLYLALQPLRPQLVRPR
jgi:hypothetical protein